MPPDLSPNINPDFLVNFLIIGTQKGGTTALAHFLSSHPQICMAPVKEVHFFDYGFDSSQDYRRYHSFFPNYSSQIAIGEATPAYMYFPWVAPRLQQYNPQLKLIVLLRHPVDRAYSQYQMEKARKWEKRSFSEAIRLEPWRLGWANWRDPYASKERSPLRTHSYSDRGFYYRQIQNLLKYFPRQNLLILGSEDLRYAHGQTLIKVYDFLGVISDVPLPQPAELLVGNYQSPITTSDRNYLGQKYQSEIAALENLLDWDLSAWRV